MTSQSKSEKSTAAAVDGQLSPVAAVEIPSAPESSPGADDTSGEDPVTIEEIVSHGALELQTYVS
jgi:hypothetical protein